VCTRLARDRKSWSQGRSNCPLSPEYGLMALKRLLGCSRRGACPRCVLPRELPTGPHSGPTAALCGPPPPVDIGIPRGIPLGEEVNLATMVLQGRGRTACYKGVSLLRHGGMRALAASWRMDQERVADAEARLSQVVSVAALRGEGREPWRACSCSWAKPALSRSRIACTK
jgi:hypothetical protein